MKQVFLVGLMAAILFNSCRLMDGKHMKGDGNLVKDQRTVGNFTGVETHGSIDIVVVPGDYKIVVESDQNIVPYIVTEVENNILKVHFKEGFGSYNYTSATVYVTAPSLNLFGTHGSGNINGEGKFSGAANAQVTVGGSGDIKVGINAPVVAVDISGSGNVTINGETKDLTTEINGSGDVRAYDLKAETVKSSVHGSGDTEVSASVKLDVEVYGSGDVHYKGSPQVGSSIHGSGAVEGSN